MVIVTLPELGNNESLLVEVPDVNVKDVIFTLFLTNKRLILSEKGTRGEISSQIPLPVIVSTESGNNDSGEAVLTVSIKAPDGSDRKMMFGFRNNPKTGDRSSERDTLLYAIERGELPSGVGSEMVFGERRSHDENSSGTEMISGNESDPNPAPSYPSGNVFHQPPPSPYPPVSDAPLSQNGGIYHSSGFERGRNNIQRADENSTRRPSSYDAFRQPPPPPPQRSGNIRDSFVDADSSYDFGSSKQSNPYSYDPFPDERVAPQYARRFERHDGGRPGRQAESEFIYAPPSGRRQRAAPKRNGYGSRNAVRGYSGSDSVPETIIGLIRSPGEIFREVRNREVEEAVPVLLVSLAVFTFGSLFFLGMIASDASVYPYLSGLEDFGTFLFVALEIIIFGVTCTAITGVLLHFVAYYEGFDEDPGQSLKVAAYSAVPYTVGGIIPFFGIIIAPLWSIYLQYTGMQETFYMESDQAVVAVLVPAAVFAVFFIILIMLGADDFSFFGGV